MQNKRNSSAKQLVWQVADSKSCKYSARAGTLIALSEIGEFRSETDSWATFARPEIRRRLDTLSQALDA